VDNAQVTETVRLPTGLTLSCVDQGDRSPDAVVLLPGPTDSWLSYASVLDRMPESLRCIAVSQRGHGDSDKPGHGYSVADFAADVPLLLDALEVARAVLVAHSGSCLTARRVALDHPDRVAGLVLEASPTTLANDPGLRDFVASAVTPLSDPIDAAFARSFVLDTSAPDLDPHLADALVAELLKVPARVWREMFSGLLAYDDTSELGRIPSPTLLIWGDADELVKRDMQDEILRRVPTAELAVYERVGHTPRWEATDRFAADLADFAARVRRHGATVRGQNHHLR
jgi:pimeloyl-ACP methyl ester carboxylesterase